MSVFDKLEKRVEYSEYILFLKTTYNSHKYKNLYKAINLFECGISTDKEIGDLVMKDGLISYLSYFRTKKLKRIL